jgi:molybdenum cofactor synthesis domain-containing protein
VVTISDRVSRGTATDLSGPLLCQILTQHGAKIANHCSVTDDEAPIQKAVLDLVRERQVNLVITTGGTGLGPRDITPEALIKISDKRVDGIGELLRMRGAKHIHTAWLSRSLGCIIDSTLVIALPGSQNAVKEGLDALLPILSHALHTLGGGHHD